MSMQCSHHRPARRRSGIAVVALASLGVVFAGGNASAGRIEGGQYRDTGSETLDVCPGIPLLHTWDVAGSFVGVAQGAGQLPHYRGSERGTQVYTNLLTHKSYTERFAGSGHDLSVTDNGDDTLTVVNQSTGMVTWYDSTGKAVLRDPGLTRGEFLIDDGGTPSDPFDDAFIGFVGVAKASTGRNDLDGRDFCADIALFTS